MKQQKKAFEKEFPAMYEEEQIEPLEEGKDV